MMTSGDENEVNLETQDIEEMTRENDIQGTTKFARGTSRTEERRKKGDRDETSMLTTNLVDKGPDIQQGQSLPLPPVANTSIHIAIVIALHLLPHLHCPTSRENQSHALQFIATKALALEPHPLQPLRLAHPPPVPPPLSRAPNASNTKVAALSTAAP